MKKIVLLGLVLTSFTACNNSADTTSEKKDSLDSTAKVMKDNNDSIVDRKDDKIDSITEMKKDALDKQDSSKHSKDSSAHQ